MIVFPNAKINIGLDILRKRPDDYHDISTLMVPVGWCDVLELIPSRGTATTLTVTGRKVDCPPEKNLVMKAYRALADLTGGLPPVDIYLRKIIPDGAGLGGGSSDASFTIKALNSLFSLGYTDAQLADVAATIGADCPLFIYNRPMIASGTGTTLADYPLPSILCNLKIAIVKPDAGVSTAAAYAGVIPAMPSISLSERLRNPIEEWTGRVKNDFEASVFPLLPQVNAIKHHLLNMGAVYASMSGSGSAVYGFFDADILSEELSREFPGCSTCLTAIID